MLKVAVDGGPLESGDSVRGIGVYTRELLKALNMQGVDVRVSNLGKYNVVHFTRFNPFSVSVPFKKPRGVKFVLTIYDLIPLIYPKNYPPGIKGWINWEINKFLIKKNIDAVITISETSKKDICRFIGINPKKVFVTYLAPRDIFKKLETGSWKLDIRKQYGLPDRFVLYVGDVNYNKNIPNLIKACKLAKIPLVIAGKQAINVENMDLSHPELRHLQGIDWSEVVRLGFVPDEDLVKIYNLASVYIQPSFYEGFGLPLIEAVACNTAVVSSKTQSLCEILGDDYKLVDPKSIEDMTKGILNPNKGRKLQRSYSWHKTADETYKIYSNIAK